ncbi:hypothetical protein LTR36_008208 [Oleoguttula mirabilis]|uniref:protein-tyrosine-phosphatase n=1 Tax=Oleoguttula mirabilis TaxID=1507867 RepID=A0AAV9J897_9PEZI|nr:hypothetical protein LTR36_008208 [Oleoguttula mirabilis]
MTETATSPRLHHPPSSSSSRPPKSAKTPSAKTPSAKTPSARAPSTKTHSASRDMPPLATPRLASPLEKQQAHSTSPNYFGFQNNDGTAFLTDSPHHAKANWSPPSSAVRSTAAASPSILPANQNPDFDAFRRQSEGKAFSLGHLGGGTNFNMNAPPAGRPQHGRTTSKTNTSQPAAKTVSDPRDMPPSATRPTSNMSLDPSMAELSRSPKRLLSPGSAAQLEPIRKGSPATFVSGEHDEPERPQSQPRFKLPLDPNGPHTSLKVQRAETLPASTPSEPEQLLVTPQHVVNLMESKTEEILILDLRVSTHYMKSHIAGALNLCIPTTLLKRLSFNVKKLTETFKDEEQRSKFENWRNSSYIIVYDTSSAQLKDAQICLNTIKKFQGEGYEGTLYIVRGGFQEFSKSFSNYVGAGLETTASAGQQSGGGSTRPEIAPVIGGCPMPGTDRPANPFFGNIRQNMDLIGGVGQIALTHPAKVDHEREDEFPNWLRRAAEDQDQGKMVSGKFEAIERREKKRMEDALSGQVSYGSSAALKPQKLDEKEKTTIAGIEKGNKNRYNNIWPFEHSRVKLQGVPKTGCDYFNANYIQAAWSNKRYISTQAPIPATFNDFWNVVWQQDVRVVVMLTAEKEGAQVKAHNYWDQKHYGPLYLEFLSEKRASLETARIHKHQQQKRPGAVKRASTRSMHPQIPLATLDPKEDVGKSGGSEQPYVTVRKFMLRDERQPFEPMREITQLQYSSWPDFGAPAHPQHLLGLVAQTDAVVRATNKTHGGPQPDAAGERPVLVHCSAGCGRTGTFCTVDSVIDMLKRQRMSQRQARQRQGTPMEIDEKTPTGQSRSPGHRGKTDSKTLTGDFFGSQPAQHTADASGQGDEEGLDGAWVQGGEVDLVEKTVEDFRRQRLSMVQSLRQFVLCYESVMEWLVEQQSPSLVDSHAMDGRRDS